MLDRTPVIIRVDGKAFHSFTRGLDKPFDQTMVEVMTETAIELCKQVQCCVFAYTQSDEISLFLNTYQNLTTAPWFGNKVQKMASVAASIATVAFNDAFEHEMEDRLDILTDAPEDTMEKRKKLAEVLLRRAYFDARCFNVPREEVANYFIWRQQDAVRNSIQSLAHANFSHKQLQGLDTDQLQELLFQEKGINWANLPTHLKRGTCIRRQLYFRVAEDHNRVGYERRRWEADFVIPIFTQDRDYIERHVNLVDDV